ncbi:MAG: UbiA family prenyltransferase, partial [Thiomicrorhabdus sp.]|nr:UbiA family prenyltransferase [Thiomicrorhabdus sp.]
MNSNTSATANTSVFTGLLKLMRPKQWIKNAFVFAPLMFTGLFLDLTAISQTVIAFVLFSLAASATYIVNDLRDIEHDRKHPVKAKKRPLASGQVTAAQAKKLLF